MTALYWLRQVLQDWGSVKEEFHFYPLDPKHFIPAGGQGILAVEAKTGSPAAKLASVIDCPTLISV